jgi:hypothetical protein
MKKVDVMPQSSKVRYPWDDILDGSVWLLDPVAEFGSKTVESFRTQAHTAARYRGLKATVRVKPEGVYVQAVPR